MYARLAYGTRALCRAACDARSRSPRAATRLKGRGYESINVVRVVKVRLCVAVPYKVHKAVNLIRGSGSEHTTHKHYTRTKKRLSGPYTLHRSRYKETRFTSKISTIFTAVSDGCGMVAVWRGWGVGPGLGARNAPPRHTHTPATHPLGCGEIRELCAVRDAFWLLRTVTRHHLHLGRLHLRLDHGGMNVRGEIARRCRHASTPRERVATRRRRC